MPKLLFLTQRIPYPPNKGDKIRALKIFEHLRQWYDIYLGCPVDDPADWDQRETMAAKCADSYFAPLDRRRAKILCLRGLLTGRPLSVEFFQDAGLAAWTRRVLDEVKPDAIFVYSSNMAPYILDLRSPGQRCIVDLVDVDSEKWRAYGESGRGPMRWIYRREWRLILELERRIARECDAGTFVSADEARLFTRLVPEAAAKVHAISNGVDQVFFDPARDYPAPYETDASNPRQADYVFTGTMDYAPNIEAVTWFVQDILPLIRRTLPHARFHIVGHSPTEAVQRLAETPGVFVTGRVADVRPYIAHATAAVAPMRIARGIQNKVLEAMAMALPVVATGDALEGIEAERGSEVLQADTTADFAALCCQAASAEFAAGIGAAARRRVLADYVWAERLHGFDALFGVSHAATSIAEAETVR